MLPKYCLSHLVAVGDRDLRIFENAGGVKAGELASLIGIEYPRFGVFDNRHAWTWRVAQSMIAL